MSARKNRPVPVNPRMAADSTEQFQPSDRTWAMLMANYEARAEIYTSDDDEDLIFASLARHRSSPDDRAKVVKEYALSASLVSSTEAEILGTTCPTVPASPWKREAP